MAFLGFVTIPSLPRLLDYARVQMAAEALYGYDCREQDGTGTGKLLSPGAPKSNFAIETEWLTDGNGHASRFTAEDAAKFAAEWKVVEHKSNTGSGFSGTLFQRRIDDPVTGGKAGDYVLSLRSTEFIDDAARDSEATNQLEIQEKGWAFGQIDDLEQWYQTSLKDKIKGAKLDVTGYSLGGHLATAFNLMHRADLNGGEVVTFNGAGVGRIGLNDVAAQAGQGEPTLLSKMIDEFHALRTNADDSLRALFQTPKGQTLYDGVKATLDGKRRTAANDPTERQAA